VPHNIIKNCSSPP